MRGEVVVGSAVSAVIEARINHVVVLPPAVVLNAFQDAGVEGITEVAVRQQEADLAALTPDQSAGISVRAESRRRDYRQHAVADLGPSRSGSD